MGEVLRSTGGEDDGTPEDIEEGILVCDNPSCQRRYPIIAGIPVVLPDPDCFASKQLLALSCFMNPKRWRRLPRKA